MRTAQDFIVEIPVLNHTDQITKARQILRDDRFREVYIVDAKKHLIGYIDITDGLRVTATKSNVTIEGFVKDAPVVHGGDFVETVAKKMNEYHTDSAVVVNSEPHIIGGILLSDLFPVIISRNELHGLVSERMSRKVVFAEPEDHLQKVYTMILESGFSTFPVIRKKNLAGIISRRDLISSRRVRFAIAQHNSTPVGDIMMKDVVTIAPDEPISAAAELIVKHDVSLLPVMDGERLVGVVNRHDVIRAMS
jgi:CBS domain-containing protein